MAVHLCQSADEGGDLLQEALVRAIQNADNLPRGSRLIAWIATVMRNMAIDRWRKRAREAVEGPGFFDDHAAANDPEPEPAWAALTSEQVRATVERLTPALRSVFLLHLRGENYQAIGLRLGIPVNTVGTRVFRARRKLRELLERELEAAAAARARGAQRRASAASAERA
jgi:RNA polymerase sigma-70 factor (ECF subfamily)